jgi:adenylylsulfate kinase-like enzyme
MIYFFTGNPNTGKSTLGKLLTDFLKTERRNWRKSVFHIDENHITDIFPIQFDNPTHLTNYVLSIAKFIHLNECDVVVSSVSPDRLMRELFKSEINGGIVEIYLTRKDTSFDGYEPPLKNFIEVNTTKSSPTQSFSFIITELKRMGVL